MKSILETNAHSLTEKVFSEIEQAILSGIYSAGDQLVESKISLVSLRLVLVCSG